MVDADELHDVVNVINEVGDRGLGHGEELVQLAELGHVVGARLRLELLEGGRAVRLEVEGLAQLRHRRRPLRRIRGRVLHEAVESDGLDDAAGGGNSLQLIVLEVAAGAGQRAGGAV